MKRFRLFAGPNGSGKTSLIEELSKNYDLGYFVNADEIQKQLNNHNFIDCENFFPVNVRQEDWGSFLEYYRKADTRVKKTTFSLVKITENVLTTPKGIDGYLSAIIASFFRYILLDGEETFSFETVMSHYSKVDFLSLAKEKGFKTYLYFISTRDVSINKRRVEIRAEKGGHSVPDNKIESRYYKSMELLGNAFQIADRAFIIDNSTNEGRTVNIEKNKDYFEILVSNLPEWIQNYLLEKL